MSLADPLSLEADRLLSLAERNPQQPHYGEQAFRRKLRVSEYRRRKLAPAEEASGVCYLRRRECHAIIERAGLTACQWDVVRKRLLGWTFEEIGRFKGHSKQGAQSIFAQGARKIRLAYESYPHLGMAETYRQEIQRGNRLCTTGKLKT